MTFHREGKATLIVALLFSVGFVWLCDFIIPGWGWMLGGTGSLLVIGLVVNFFRMPARTVQSFDERDVICPSDGKVVVIERVVESEWFQDERIQVSVFMSPLNVHAQWAPIAGVVRAARYHAGKYLVAWHPKSSTENERTSHVIEGKHGTVLFRQIAGALARRICWYITEDQQVAAGEEVGFIKFGSRVDVFLPLDAEICVELDQHVTGKETILARLPQSE